MMIVEYEMLKMIKVNKIDMIDLRIDLSLEVYI